MKAKTKQTPEKRETLYVMLNPWMGISKSEAKANVEAARAAKDEEIFAVTLSAAAVADDLLKMLVRLTEKTERANAIQHSGGILEADDWSELHMLTNEAHALIVKAEGGAA